MVVRKRLYRVYTIVVLFYTDALNKRNKNVVLFESFFKFMCHVLYFMISLIRLISYAIAYEILKLNENSIKFYNFAADVFLNRSFCGLLAHFVN